MRPSRFADRLGPGRPLDSQTRQRMESAFGDSFGHVQVHAGPEAAAETRAYSAQALTVGQHIAFAPGNYRPGTPVGDAMLAHELAHTIQQGEAGGGRRCSSRPAPRWSGTPIWPRWGRCSGYKGRASPRPPARSPRSGPPCAPGCACSAALGGEQAPAKFDGGFDSHDFDPHVRAGPTVFEGRDGQCVVSTEMNITSGSADAVGGTDERAREWEAGFIQTAFEAEAVRRLRSPGRRRNTTSWSPHPSRPAPGRRDPGRALVRQERIGIRSGRPTAR